MNPIHPALARLARAAEHQDFAELEETLHVALRKPTWLRPEHRVGDPKAYMRHLLYVDPKDSFVITAITWLPGQQSAVHGHHVWCMYGVAEGELTEDQFNEELTVTRTRLYKPGDLADGDLEQKAIHRVANRGRSRVVSLHLYGIAADHLTTGINRIYRI
ncbi:MAG TPA: cysteine dioxygenase family protein [Burkholderiales bacterium]|nr:cysteine dioxygenase family protein [Burkholderiales bacterium]